MPDSEPIDTADHVLHEPTGETWLVAYVRDGRLCACGWPESIVPLTDCKLVKRATDAEREKLLLEMAGGAFGTRGGYARDRLSKAAVVTGLFRSGLSLRAGVPSEQMHPSSILATGRRRPINDDGSFAHAGCGEAGCDEGRCGTRECLPGVKAAARAAAQSVPSITLSVEQLRDALACCGESSPDEEAETMVSIAQCEARTSSEGEPMPAGAYLWFTDLPDEGCQGPLGSSPEFRASLSSQARSEAARSSMLDRICESLGLDRFAMVDTILARVEELKRPGFDSMSATREARLRSQMLGAANDIETAISTFRRYELLHRAKGTDDSTAKADANAVIAQRLEARFRTLLLTLGNGEPL